ncbi:hypothetical protein [Photobacterium kishitanii]|uniref:Leucine-rich repeat domain-containing protein n=1 Tax=Photobacterium kishitanii TaxID=318456 RepID=A0A2T3KC73_9GAMM|nr:hypothetical protein [Photobacterium kishitanii]PSU86533.1 hypothetical protein C0W42_20285 [Photobacterium kishitanii]PSU92868.1 hypothetical protein C9J27_22110 [Photobacterium kishitanii]
MKNSRIWPSIIAIIIGSIVAGCAQQVQPTLTSLTFIDPNFKRCVFAQGEKNIKQITSLKCSHFNIRDAREVRYLSHLKTLDLSSNQLTYLDVSHNPQLQVLSVEHNKLAHLNLTHNPQLQIVNVSFNRLKALNVSYNPLLTYLNYDDTLIHHVDISRNPRLLTPFHTIDVPNGPTIMAE